MPLFTVAGVLRAFVPGEPRKLSICSVLERVGYGKSTNCDDLADMQQLVPMICGVRGIDAHATKDYPQDEVVDNDYMRRSGGEGSGLAGIPCT